MRVSDKATYQLHQKNLSRLKSAWTESQEQAVRGRRVLKPSDDPLATSLAVRERSKSARADSYSRSIDMANHRLDATDRTLGDVASALRRVRELTVQASNDTITALERTDIAVEIRSLRDTIHSLANTKEAGSFIFAGFPDDSAPFDPAGTFLGSSDVAELEVSPGVRVAVGIAGDEAFSGAGGGVDVFTVIDDLVTALETDDIVGIQGSLDTVDAAHAQVVSSRGEVGSRQVQLDVSQGVVDRFKDRAEIRQGELIGKDSVDAILELEQAQGAYQAAVQIASQLPGPSLVGG
ncbi:MAG: flagellar hook-associated protein FlgL [Myxococcota bacterium]